MKKFGERENQSGSLMETSRWLKIHRTIEELEGTSCPFSLCLGDGLRGAKVGGSDLHCGCQV